MKSFSNIPYTPHALSRQAALDFLRTTVDLMVAGRQAKPEMGPALLASAGRGSKLIANEPEYKAAMWLRCA